MQPEVYKGLYKLVDLFGVSIDIKVDGRISGSQIVTVLRKENSIFSYGLVAYGYCFSKGYAALLVKGPGAMFLLGENRYSETDQTVTLKVLDNRMMSAPINKVALTEKDTQMYVEDRFDQGVVQQYILQPVTKTWAKKK